MFKDAHDFLLENSQFIHNEKPVYQIFNLHGASAEEKDDLLQALLADSDIWRRHNQEAKTVSSPKPRMNKAFAEGRRENIDTKLQYQGLRKVNIRDDTYVGEESDAYRSRDAEGRTKETEEGNPNSVTWTEFSAIDVNTESGLQALLNAAVPEAFHDSSARYPPPRCHHGTREQYIEMLTGFGSGTSARSEPEKILWLYGPAGVGKSAVAQSCAEALARSRNLGGSFFFSRLSRRNNPNALFPSISYQIATKAHLYGAVVDHQIRKDPTIVTKSIREQFQELFLKPIGRLQNLSTELRPFVVIIDGLDECDGHDATCDIIEIIAESARMRTTPLRWICLSRPEPHIVATFNMDDMPSLCRQVELPVSRKVDHEILLLLVDELTKVRKKFQLPESWPSEKDFQTLVDLCAGLFIYAATIIRFVNIRNALSPVDQLDAVLKLAHCIKPQPHSDHPLAELDAFYKLIMSCVPPKIFPVIQKILLVKSLNMLQWKEFVKISNVLGLSESQFRNATGSLSSVLDAKSLPVVSSQEIRFYHASFMDFLQDEERSGKFCIYSECLTGLRQELLERLNQVHTLSKDENPIPVQITWPDSPIGNEERLYRLLLRVFLCLFQSFRPLDPVTAASLQKFQFSMIPRLCNRGTFPGATFPAATFSPEKLIDQIPVSSRHKIAYLSYDPLVLWCRPRPVRVAYALGTGKNVAVCWQDRQDYWTIAPYPTFSGLWKSSAES
ncbi:hypothetical protein D9756_000215 [Leucocoprinus leucothites]|uniref:NACHT domain-containing protein n=1 Tax=Leucocoprinus leucothites TaxID=201217 RepID=A0A8H5LNR2_9AGAR|nr:hypothetical protein D9756_000215 [Leucoagaricus leucothites]